MVQPRADLERIQPYRPGKPIEEVCRELGLKKVIKLASNENPLGTSPKAIRAIRKAIKESFLYPDDINYYLKKKLSEKFNIDESCIITGNGSVEIIYLACLAFLTPPNDELIVSKGSFVLAKIGSQVAGAKCVEIPLKEYRHDLERILASLTPNTKIIYLDIPINPLGTIVYKKELEDFMEKVPDNILVIFDEAYYEYITEKKYPDTFRYLRKGKNVLILRTFSKIYGLAGLRIGYGFSKPEIISALNKVRYPFHVNRLAQIAAIAALDDTRFVKKSIRNNEMGKKYLYKELTKIKNVFFLESHANFIFINFPVDSQIIFEKLLRLGVITRTLKEYDFPNALRVTIGKPEENEYFIKCLNKVLAEIT
jgi:histidinol-phosphate aminotransferase